MDNTPSRNQMIFSQQFFFQNQGIYGHTSVCTISDPYIRCSYSQIYILQKLQSMFALYLTYRVSLKKGNLSILVLFLFKKSDFTFSHVFRNQNFKVFSSSHSNYIHSESKLPKKTQKHAAQTWFLEYSSSNFWSDLPTWTTVGTTTSSSTMCCLGLRVLNNGKHNRLWWQQDVTDANMRYIDRQFDGRVISRRTAQNSCPHKSFLHFWAI